MSERSVERVIGVASQDHSNQFNQALRIVLRHADPDLLVLCTDTLSDENFNLVKNAFLAGHRILLIHDKKFAPHNTKWAVVDDESITLE